jgi:hypothetical protein
MAWINWLLKPKCMLIHILFWNFLCCVKIWCYNIYIYILERLGRMHENKTFFENLTKTDYFNTGFVSLQYKNTNRYWSKYSNKITENHIFWNNFLKNFCSSGPDPAQKETGPKSARNKLGPGFYRAGLSPAQNHMAGYCSLYTQCRWTVTR